MSNLEDKFEKLLGGKLTDDRKQELLKMSKTLEIADNDALWSILAMYYTFDARFAKIPKQIEQAANAAAESAAKQAEAQINQAVASLAPAMQKTVEKAANRAVGRLQLAESAGMIFAAIVAMGLFGGVCFALGNRSYGMFQEQKISAIIYWEQMKWAISSGFIVPGFLMSGYLVLRDGDYDWQKLGYFLILVGVGVTAVLPLKLLGFIH